MEKYLVTYIKYDTDGKRIKLPKKLEIEVPTEYQSDDEIVDYLSDEISNVTGFCHFGFSFEKINLVNKK